jgi:hypothetical protein
MQQWRCGTVVRTSSWLDVTTSLEPHSDNRMAQGYLHTAAATRNVPICSHNSLRTHATFLNCSDLSLISECFRNDLV